MDENTIAAISTVRDYENYLEFVTDLQWHMHRYTLEELSYSKWVISEILNSLEETDSEPPLLIFNNLKIKMDEYSLFNSKASVIFSIASRVIEDIIDGLVS